MTGDELCLCMRFMEENMLTTTLAELIAAEVLQW